MNLAAHKIFFNQVLNWVHDLGNLLVLFNWHILRLKLLFKLILGDKANEFLTEVGELNTALVLP